MDEEEGATLVLTVAYDGADFNGFARQDGLPTVQGALEDALTTLFRRPCELTCAGRTDAGVHALGQQVSLQLSTEETELVKRRNASRILLSLNALTPDAVSVRDWRFERPGFSARFDAVSRTYRYRVVCGTQQPVFLAKWAWWLHRRELDVSAMLDASRCLVGEHDFASFCVAKSAAVKPTCRYLEPVRFFEEEALGERCLAIEVTGNAFLHNMVRCLIGSLVEVGVGHRSPGWLEDVLQACDRRAAGPTAPAHGLTFWSVSYEGTRRH